MNYLVAAVVAVAAGWLARWLWLGFLQYRRVKHYMDLLPGDKPRPFPVGHYGMLSSKHDEWFRDVYALFQRVRATSPLGVFQFWLGPFPYAVLTKGVAAETVLSSSRHIEKGRDYDFLRPWLASGLLTSSGEKWRSRRKFLTPAFHFHILNDFLEVFYEQSVVLVQQLTARAGAEADAFDIYPFITRCTLDIISETAMGKKINAQTNSESEYVKAVYSVSDIIFDRMIRPTMIWDPIFYTLGRGQQFKRDLKTLHDFTDRVIEERRSGGGDQRRSSAQPTPPAGGGKRGPRMAFLDSLLQARTEDGQLLDNASIREEVDTFMFEGHDTTAAAANFAVYLLGGHPDVQEKARQEVDAVFGRSTRCPTVEDLKSLPYLEKVIKETLRLFPSVPFITRKVNEDFHIGEHLIPAGSSILVYIYAMHRDEDVFPEPHKFDPDRFDTAGEGGGDAFSTAFDYVPFSAGPRNCIGQRFALMEEKTILSTLLRHFTVESLVPLEDFTVQGQLITRPVQGVRVRLHKRIN
ncbi:cytochrome P450 4V2-like [Paramacrobiotus metropolitanus]|uniref:cytochrome P450 4V2-like n=1 Tax=Paramacrobiotus metropolitanus TaxID=2943436 RepID=UPI002445FAD3|nr:cytochrome P450 4V2-like [Paramacrobiotus metropolitanus]